MQPTKVRRESLGSRGIVTVEMAYGLMILVLFMGFFCWVLFLVGAQIACVDTAVELARQEARGNHEAVAELKEDVPAGTSIDVDSDGDEVVVEVRMKSKPADWIPAVTLRAEATALKEPGE